jgi:hypothetical protein
LEAGDVRQVYVAVTVEDRGVTAAGYRCTGTA